MQISKKKYKKMLHKIARYKVLKDRLEKAGTVYVKERPPYSKEESYTRLFV